MTDRTPLDDVEFLARSNHRVSVVETLQSGARTRADLRDETGISQPTLGRILTGLRDRNWIRQDGQAYSLTPLGRMLAESFSALLETVETIQELSDVVAVLPDDYLGFDLRLLREATITEAEPNDVLVHIRRAEQMLADADDVRVLTPSIFPGAFEKLVAGRSPRYHEAILTAEALEAMRATPPLVEATRALIANDGLEVFRYDGSVPVMLAMVDQQAIIAPLGENDLPRALIESDHRAICSWVNTELDAYRDAATPVRLDDLAT
ncbi:MAG: hypothetical protein R3324_07280 [Halobacteriales archaeon]|nr:hypothetical protein [Halobacteriales archaeon]